MLDKIIKSLKPFQLILMERRDRDPADACLRASVRDLHTQSTRPDIRDRQEQALQSPKGVEHLPIQEDVRPDGMQDGITDDKGGA